MNTLFTILFFITMSSGIITPLIGPLIFSERGFFTGSSLEHQMQAYALIMGGYALGLIIGNIIWGILSDKIGGRKAIIWALIGSTLSYLLCCISLFFTVFFFIFLGRCLDGLMAGRRAVVLSMIVQMSQEDKITTFRHSEIVNALGLLLGPLLGGLLVNFSPDAPLYYYSTPFLVMGFVMIGTIILVVKNTAIKPKMKNSTKAKKSFFQLHLLFLYFIFFILQLSWYLYFLSITPYIIVHWKFTPLAVGVLFSLLVLIYIAILLWVFPFLKHLIGEKGLSLLSLVIGGLSMILMGIDTNHYYLFLIYNVGVILAFSCNIPIFMAQITSLKEENEQGKTIGIQNSIIGLAWIFSALGIGFLSASMTATFLLSGMLLALIPLLQWMGKNL